MDKPTRDDFKTLLLDQPFWADERERRAFLHDLFTGHPILNKLQIHGPPGVVASELLDLCDSFDAYLVGDRSPCCAVIAAIRAEGKTGGGETGTALTRIEPAICTKPPDETKPRWDRPPYPGLVFFDRQDAPIFFGREAETRELVDVLNTEQGRRFLIVTGASGSGKSSLVRAGLWAWLAQGKVPQIPNSASWLITAMTPSDWGDDPLRALIASVDRAKSEQGNQDLSWLFHPGREYKHLQPVHDMQPCQYPLENFLALIEHLLQQRPGAEWLLILDQMEELFTPEFAQIKEGFLDLLWEASKGSDFRIIATVCADFLSHCINHPGLCGVLNRGGQFSVGRPHRLALERMVAGPVTDVELIRRNAQGVETTLTLELDPDLAPCIAAEAMDQEGGLALMAFALREHYDACMGCSRTRRLDLKTYVDPAFGGLGGAIARRADEVLDRFGDKAQKALFRLFALLVYVREQGGVATRRIEPLDTWAADSTALDLIEAFTSARLFVKRGRQDEIPSVEVAHEALLREWPKLVEWIADKQEALRLRDRVVREAKTWATKGRPDFQLWRHELLDPARALLEEAGLLIDLESNHDIEDFLIPESDRLEAELLCNTTDHPRREQIGVRLSEIGDTRRGVGVIDGVLDILWCPIPAGKVMIEEQEQKHTLFEVSSFQMSAYPITHAHYQVFLQANDGYRSDDWWTDLEKQPEPGSQLRPYASYPADNVSWYDATAFCRWLSARLGFDVWLPNEWEWQWAAQSARDDFVYPWGPQWQAGVANTYESGIGRTTAVGMYPGGRSEQGVYDLAGNVWEWCRNLYADPRRAEPKSDASRGLRGGSWYFNRGPARAGARSLDHPDGRADGHGFRVVFCSPIR